MWGDGNAVAPHSVYLDPALTAIPNSKNLRAGTLDNSFKSSLFEEP